MKRKTAIRRVKSKIGQNIRFARERMGMTQSELSHKCGMNSSAISHFESGRREPLLSSVQRIAKALGITIDDLINW